MGVEAIESSFVVNMASVENSMLHDEPLNGTDARRRLEDKIEDLKLQKELQEFDFDL